MARKQVPIGSVEHNDVFYKSGFSQDELTMQRPNPRNRTFYALREDETTVYSNQLPEIVYVNDGMMQGRSLTESARLTRPTGLGGLQ